ncbi:MAG TPA: ABC transporter ATP-binding protein [Firmicutes bacterium]|jgi:ABC-2 type transport system ATP-binding protein|nr:ABC transporter ATP-binding protein [Bacillota bacterium]HBT16402.1 ABC transporter ATP-binding protein [Bacillota bacterium]
MEKEIIRLEKINKTFTGTKIINNLSFSVQRGEILGFLGPNGSGKTTTIRLINGVIYPDSGQISVAGFDPVTAGNEVRKRCGVLTESAGLYENMTALDNLLFFAELYEVKSPLSRAKELLADFGLSDATKKKVGIFSSGMKKRLGIAKALLHNPEILFLDEPTNGLDPEGARDLINYIKELNRKYQVTVLLATHLLKQVQDLCHRFIFIHQGRLLETGILTELEEKYLRSISLKVETGLEASGEEFAGYRIENRAPGYLHFQLEKKDDIPLLLKEILLVAPVYSVEMSGRDLEALYFKIREERR